VTVGWVWIVLALVGPSSPVLAQASARIVSIEGAGTTYQSIDRGGKPVTVRVPSQSAADIQGKDAQGNVTGTVTALDLPQRRVKVQTSAGQTIVLELSPAALQEMQVGKARTPALKDMAGRVHVQEVSTFVAAIYQADQLGVSMAKVLHVQADTMRIARSQRIREMAAKLPVKMLFPLVFFIFPAIFVIIIGPGVISIMKTLVLSQMGSQPPAP
jgi:hypothetical protein